MPNHLWIIGRGLLGSHIADVADQHDFSVWQSSNHFFWDDHVTLASEFPSKAQTFFAHTGDQPWSICWTAGRGTMGSTADEMHKETQTFDLFLRSLDAALPTTPGQIFLASSAGSIYGHSDIATESTIASPATEYGKQKLKQEELLQEWLAKHSTVSGLIGRISNVYGPKQNPTKPQGLISHVSRSIILRKIIHIYVPLDTIRDYLYVEDCAHDILRSLKRLSDEPSSYVLKIFASGEITTIAQIIGTFKSIVKTNPRIIHAPTTQTASYPRSIRFHSKVWPELHVPRTHLIEGIAKLHRYQLATYAHPTYTGL